MAFLIVNPAWKSAVQIKAETHAPTVLQWLNNNAANRVVTLAELKAGLPLIAGDLTRQVVNIIADIIGAKTENTNEA